MPARRALLVTAALAAAGVAVAAALTREHVQAHAGITSFCAISDVVNCDIVATSRWSVLLGLPVAVWGVFGYTAILGLALSGLRSRLPHPRWPTGLLSVLGAAATAVAVGLALIELVIGALCLLCAASWILSAGIFAAACRATGPGGVGQAVRKDVAALRARPSLTVGIALGCAALVALVAAAYPRYWERPRRAPAPAPAADAASARSMVVVEFSDYACPFCARAHDDAKAVLAERPDVYVVQRNFPLDSSCNPAVKRMVHPGACVLARAGICAEAQGKLPQMADALFHNQGDGRSVEALARDVGLDPSRFKACLVAPETQHRLESDIAAGIAAGLRATPTWIVNGRSYAGEIPVEALPAARAASR